MSIYTEAIRLSKKGRPQYIVSKSLDTVLVWDKASLLKFLKDGYRLQAKYVNGVRESSWRVQDKAALKVIAEICDLKTLADAQFIQVNTQDFLSEDGERVEQIVMYLVIWKYGQKAETYWVTVKDRVSKPELFAALQEKASRILDTVRLFHIKEDSELTVKILEKELKVACMDFNSLANRCGYFHNAYLTDGVSFNNGYNCRHPNQGETIEEDGKRFGGCYCWSCPLGYPPDGDQLEELGILSHEEAQEYHEESNHDYIVVTDTDMLAKLRLEGTS